MKKSKTTAFIAIIFVISIIAVGTVFANGILYSKIDDSYNKAVLPGIQITEYYGKSQVITSDEATKSAIKEFPELSGKPVNSNELVAFTFGSYTLFGEEALEKNPELQAKGYLENAPVYVVEFGDLHIKRSGPPSITDEEREKTALTKQFVVVDAKSACVLLSYNSNSRDLK